MVQALFFIAINLGWNAGNQAGAKNRSFSSSSPNVLITSCSRSVGRLRGRFLYCATISSFFIECSQPTSSVTLT